MVGKQITKSRKGNDIKKRAKQRNDCSNNGYVLVFVLWAIAMLSMVALGFSKDTRISILLNSISTERMKDFYATRGAAIYALNKMSESGSKSTIEPSSQPRSGGGKGFITPAEPPTDGALLPSGDDNAKEDDESQDSGGQETTKWIPNNNPYSIQIGNIYCDVYLNDENGKINLNGISDENREIFINFLTQKGIDMLDADDIVDSILDWVDPDDLHHVNGAEDNYYESLPEPYKAKNAPFDSIEELTLVRGITPEIFESIRNDITVYGGEQINININFASKEILNSIPGLFSELVDELILYLEENGPIKDSEELRQVFWSLGIIGDSFENIRPYITTEQSSFVTVRAVSKGSERKQAPIGFSDGQNRSGGYEYKLIAGRSDGEYKIFAVYPE